MTRSDGRRLQVLVVPEWYPTEASPVAGSFVSDQAQAASRFNDVVVAVDRPDGRPGTLRERAEGSVRVFELSRRSRPGPAGVFSRVLALKKFIASRPTPPDVIHAHVYASGFVSLLASVGTGIPVVLSEHTSDFLEGLVTGRASIPAHAALRGSALVCPVSDDLMRAMASFDHRGSYEVVPNVVDTEAFRNRRSGSASVGSGLLRLLSVGIMTRQKGFADLISAAGLLHAAGLPIQLDLVGDGPLRAELERQAASSLPDGSFRFLGSLPRAEVATCMSEADIYVMPSVVETFGVALVEALVAGLPVVATKVGIAPSVVSGECGVVVAPGDARALARGLESVAARLDRLDAWATGDSLVERFSAETIGRRWDAIYRRVAGR